MITWVQTNFPPLLVGNVTQVLFATQKKKFAEVTTGVLVNNKTTTLPRVTVQRLGTVNDPTRFNANRIRRMGFVSPPNHDTRLTAKFPAPINISYQIDMWTKLVSEMNLWERFVFETFTSSYIYLTIRPNDIWRDKSYFTALDGEMQDNSDLEPDEGDTLIRKTFTLRCEGWLFDDTFVRYGVVKSFETQFYNTSNELLDTSFLPPIERIATSVDGTTTVFATTLVRFPALKHAVVVYAIIAGVTIIAQDNGEGLFTGAHVASGTIDYTTGVMSVTFSTPPDVGTNVTVTYYHDL